MLPTLRFLVRSLSRSFFCGAGAGLCGAVCWLGLSLPASLQAQAAPTPVPELPAYSSIDKRQGTFNDGQSALWDLHIIDNFAIFGPVERVRGHAPQQPINFSHVLHVQKNKMECQYCHWSVSKSSFAAIPEVESCMGCHKLVLPESPEIQKLKGYYDRGEPIPWVKVHVMPDHVNFNHKRHVKAGVSCHECHGQIPKMPVVERTSSMKMGWCVDCHRQAGTSIDCWTCHK